MSSHRVTSVLALWGLERMAMNGIRGHAPSTGAGELMPASSLMLAAPATENCVTGHQFVIWST